MKATVPSVWMKLWKQQRNKINFKFILFTQDKCDFLTSANFEKENVKLTASPNDLIAQFVTYVNILFIKKSCSKNGTAF